MTTTPDLVLAALITGVAVWLSCFVLLRSSLGFRNAVLIATVKAALPVAYLLTREQLEFRFSDDQEYYDGALRFIAKFHPLTDLFSADAWAMLNQLASWGPHKFYFWWNALLVWVFGEWARNALLWANVTIAAGTALVLGRFARAARLEDGYVRMLVAVQALNPEILAWSSATNGRDTLVTFLAAGLALALLRIQYGSRRLLNVMLALLIMAAFSVVRFYTPLFMFAGWVGGLAVGARIRHKPLVILTAVCIGFIAVMLAEPRMILDAAERLDIANVLFGLPRFLLTPRPWGIDPDHAFLLLPAIWHWLMFVPAAAGTFLLWRDVPATRVLILYMAAIVVVMAMTDEFVGPRHRIQISFVYLWAAFHFFWRVIACRAIGPLSWRSERTGGDQGLST